MSKRRLWANTHWEVAEDGIASLEPAPMEYFIAKDRICVLRWGMEGRGIANFPLHIANKIERPIEPFLEAFEKAIELLKNSPYAQKLDNVGLFLKALQLRAPQLGALLTTHLGNPLAEGGTVTRLSSLETQGPALDNNKLDQIAALPLGGRVKINPWDDKAEMVKASPVAITSARDKMPFEVTPFFPRLVRFGTGVNAPVAAPATSAANSGSGN